MTSENCFTLTEMKEGLTSRVRVEELISVMQKDKDSVVKNVLETSRQWSIVASTLTATETQDSLDYFVCLGGLLFLDRWLQEALEFSDDICDNSVEEAISSLLVALRKLPVDNKRSFSTGIAVTIKKLCAHKSSRIQERARALFDGWNQGRENGQHPQGIEEFGGFLDDGINKDDETVAAEIRCMKQSSLHSTLECDTDGERMGSEHHHSRSSDSSQSKGFGNVHNSVSSKKHNNGTALNQENKEDEFRENPQVSSFTSYSCQGSTSVIEETSRCSAERMPSIGICSNPVSLEWRSSDTLKMQGHTNYVKETDVRNASPDKSGINDTSSVSASSRHEPISYADDVQQPVIQPDVLRSTDTEEIKACTAGVDDESMGVALESGILDHFGSVKELEVTDQVGVSYSNGLHDTSSEVCKKLDNPEASFSGKQDSDTSDNMEELSGESTLEVRNGYATSFAISKPEVDLKASEINKISEMDLDYGLDDALEVARQVAKEVEREVVDYREELCSSSSEKIFEGRAGSPDSINGKGDQSVSGPQNEMPDGETPYCSIVSPNREDQLMNSEHENKTEDFMHKTDSFQGIEFLQKPAEESKKSPCEFDLNEVCPEEMDHPTITFVSAAKVSPAGVPKAPLHFEGELGWKGSAATSAFRPASARRTLDGEKPFPTEGSSQSSKQRQGFLNFDLNVAECDGDGALHPVFGNQIQVLSDLPSGESFVEVSSRRAQQLKLDLNRVDDNDEAPLDCRVEERFGYSQRNDCPSPASSSSSRQFPMRNIDLNGNPSFFDESSDQQPGFSKCSSLDINSSRVFKADDPVISRVAVHRPDLIPQTRSFLPNGHGTGHQINAVFTRIENGSGGHHPIGSGGHHPIAYAPPLSSPLFGYNGFPMGSSVSLPPAIYGPGSVPCMIDSRGSPVIPQMLPLSSDFPPSQPPYFMSMSGPFMGLNGVSRPSIDLNSGTTMVEAERRESGGLGQLFIPGPGMYKEEQMRGVGPGVGMRRKEPDGGWDMYPVSYKQMPPWC